MTAAVREPYAERIDTPVDPAVISRLRMIPDFVCAYEPDGMVPEDFITFGMTQRTLTQFIETGWTPVEVYQMHKPN